MAATFEYWQSRYDHQYRFHLGNDGNHEIILASTEGYKSEDGCIRATASSQGYSTPFVRSRHRKMQEGSATCSPKKDFPLINCTAFASVHSFVSISNRLMSVQVNAFSRSRLDQTVDGR
jgi:uncharacterized protein YegP (UPF0339 family)